MVVARSDKPHVHGAAPPAAPGAAWDRGGEAGGDADADDHDASASNAAGACARSDAAQPGHSVNVSCPPLTAAAAAPVEGAAAASASEEVRPSSPSSSTVLREPALHAGRMRVLDAGTPPRGGVRATAAAVGGICTSRSFATTGAGKGNNRSICPSAWVKRCG